MTVIKTQNPAATAVKAISRVEPTLDEILKALEHYNAAHFPHKGWHKITLFSNSSGYVLDPFGDRVFQFDGVQSLFEFLSQPTPQDAVNSLVENTKPVNTIADTPPEIG